MRRHSGFTLIELLTGIVIFSATIGILFSVLAAMRRSERFRNENVRLTQEANYAFEPIIRSLKTSDARETFLVGSRCLTVRGFYGYDDIVLPTTQIQDGTVFTPTKLKLVTIDTEKIFDASRGHTRQWVKREYYTRPVIGQSGRFQLIEQTYHAASTYAWPQSLGSSGSCTQPSVHWVSVGERSLTSDQVTVTQFSARMIIPVVDDGNVTGVTKSAGFASISLTIADPNARSASPVTLSSTVTPTFNYGEERD